MGANGTHGLQIRLFGGIQISRDGTVLSGFLSNKAPALLAFLAVSARPQSRDRLAALLWGELPDADAKNNLRQTLSNLRKLIDPYLDITRDSVAFNSDLPHMLDVSAFEAALHASRDLPPDARVHHLQSAVTLYLGDFLAGFHVRDAPDFEEWALAQRTRLHELALHALHTLAEYHLARGHYGRVIDHATRLLALDGWREAAHRQLMLALARSGQRAAALAQYKLCCRMLDEQLGVVPSAATRTLYERLRAAGDHVRHNLPVPMTPFVGRSDELALLDARLRQPDCRLISLVGAGGSGKTRLALAAAARARDDGLFLSGVYFVALANASDAADVPAVIASALNVTLSGQTPPAQQLIAHLRPQELLLVLDNCEHVLDMAGWLAHLLQSAPDVKLLLTTRERLALQSEWCVPVDGLALPAADDDPLRAEAVQLFLKRAHAVWPTLPDDSATLADIAHICRLVSGLPLGVELAAASLPYHSCRAIADGIAANLDFLATHYRDIPPRHRSLRAAFEHSWRLLAAVEQVAFGRLSCFAGSFNIDAAQAIGVSAHLLAALVDKSLLRRSGSGRYGLHDVIRQFATEKHAATTPQASVDLAAGDLAAGDLAAGNLAAQHSRYYLTWLSGHTAALKGRTQKEALLAVTADFDNIRRAWQTALDQQQPAWLRPAVEPLYYYCLLRSRLLEGIALFEAALATPAVSADAALMIHITNVLAKLLLGVSRVVEARALLAPLRSHAALGDSPQLEAAMQRYYGNALVSLGELTAAEAAFARSQQLAQALGDDWAEANTLIDRARLAFVRKELAQAEAYCRSGLVKAEPSGDLLLIANFLTAIGILRREMGDLDTAQTMIERSLVVYAELDDTYGLIQGHLSLGALLLRRQYYGEARVLFERALHGSRQIGFRWGEADAQWRLGQAACALGDDAAAAHAWREALEIALAIREVELIRDVLDDLRQAQAERRRFADELLAWAQRQPDLPVVQGARPAHTA